MSDLQSARCSPFTMAAPRVLISILNWNGGNSTLECLRSVFELDYPAYSVTVLDNASVDGSARLIENSFPLATVIQSANNLGFCGGHNLIIKNGLQEDFDYFWVLNNDAVVSPQSLSRVIACMETNPRIGLASPTIYFLSRPETIEFCGAWLNAPEQDYDAKGANLGDYYAKGRSFDEVRRKEESAPERMLLFGAALVLRRSLAEQVGLFNEEYFAYYEDVELSLRSAKAGFMNKMVFEANVWHNKPVWPHKPAHFFYYMTRNAYWFWRFVSRAADRPAVVRRHLARSLRWTAICRDNGLNDCGRACILGFLDAHAPRSGVWNPSREPGKVLEKMFEWHPYLMSNVLDGDVHAVITEAAKRLKR